MDTGRMIRFLAGVVFAFILQALGAYVAAVPGTPVLDGERKPCEARQAPGRPAGIDSCVKA